LPRERACLLADTPQFMNICARSHMAVRAQSAIIDARLTQASPAHEYDGFDRHS
jgi:hypothetical protein